MSERKGARRPLLWVTGAGGLIGHELVTTAHKSAPDRSVRGLTRADVDLFDFNAVAELFRKERPEAIVHCAAVSRSPVCEKNPDFAHRSNVQVTQNLLQLAADIPFFFFSSDLIFDGEKGGYVEEDAPNPLSVYGRTKLAAEEIVRTHPRHIILRISLTCGRSPMGDRAFNEELTKAWAAGKTLHLFTDEFRCPLHVQALVPAVWELLQKQVRGTYHLNGAEKLSRYEMGLLLAEHHPELKPQVVPGSRKDYQGAPRPADTSLNCSKIQKILSFPIPKLSEWLKENPGVPF